MELHMRVKYLLMGFLVAFILCLKYPRSPHEYGIDSFEVHGMAQSLMEFSYAPWLIKPSSIYALYPFSYAPGMPIILSSLSYLTGLSVEMVILVFSIVVSIIGAMGMFMFSGEVQHRFEVRFFAAFIFSFAPVFMRFTIWTISTRGPFIAMMTVLLWSLSRTMNARHKLKYLGFTLIILFILPTIHHFALLLPILLIAVLSAYLTAAALEYTDRVSIYYRENVLMSSAIILILMVFLFYLQTVSIDLYAPDMGYFFTWYIYGDRSSPLITGINILVFYGISLGILMLYAGIGLAHLIEKVDKSRVEWAILFSILFFAMFLTDKTYLIMFVTPFFVPLAAMGMAALLEKIEYRRGVYALLVGALLLIGAYYGDYATEKWVDIRTREETGYHFYMDEAPYNTAIYIKHALHDESGVNAIHNDNIHKKRLSAISGMGMLPLTEMDVVIAYPEIKDKLKIYRLGLWEMYLQHSDHLYRIDWENSSLHHYDNYSFIVQHRWDDPKVIENLTEFHVSFAVVNMYFPEEYGSSSRPFINRYSRFFATLPEGRYLLYQNSHEAIYFLLPA